MYMCTYTPKPAAIYMCVCVCVCVSIHIQRESERTYCLFKSMRFICPLTGTRIANALKKKKAKPGCKRNV